MHAYFFTDSSTVVCFSCIVLDNTACVIMEYFGSFAKVSFGSSIMVE